ncbi:MAG: DNA replication/repair protein RecF [Rhodobacteraceae bacterium]|nr:DNA replication/repair protein RecF [Paracoccaceae bacterium]
MTCAITSLTLSHFRSHKVARISCDARPVAIFGPNGAGKTNILEAVSLLSPGRGLRRSSAEDMTRRPESLGWKIAALVQTRGQAREIDIWSEAGAARQSKVDGKPTPQTGLSDILRVLWLIPAMDRLWIEGAEGRRRFLDRMTLSLYPGHAQLSLDYEKAMRERNRLLKDQIRDPAWYGALEKQMATSGTAIQANRRAALTRICAAQDSAATTFPAADLTLVHPDTPFPDDLLTAFADGRARDIAAGRTLVGPHRVDMEGIFAAKAVPAKDCSTGEQKALLVSLILANARAIADDIAAPPILLLDEVAAHLDVDRRAALYDEICALGAQAWMTGTETHLFDAMGDRAQYLHVTDANGASEVQSQ